MDHAIYISYYTRGTAYEEEVKRLEESLIKFNLPHRLYGVLSLGSWVRNCGIKPIVIKRALDEYKQPLVFLDADAVIVESPKLFKTLDCDVAAHRRPNGELLSGTLYINTTKAARHLLNKWIYEQSLKPNEWDQRTLQRVLDEDNEVRFYNLPQSYTKIFDAVGPSPVIQHNQASRRYKQMKGLYPKELGARLLNDGTFVIARASKKLREQLDRDYAPVLGEKNRWYTKLEDGIEIDEIELRDISETVYLIGKGPSLDKLTVDDFEEDYPIICINESVHTIAKLGLENELFTIQQDSALGGTCYNEASKLLLNRHAVNDDNQSSFYKLYVPENYGCQSNSLSVVLAISMFKSLGVKKFIMFGFDASMDRNIAYAESIGYMADEGGDPKRFLTHRLLMAKAAGDDVELDLRWPKPFDLEIEEEVEEVEDDERPEQSTI